MGEHVPRPFAARGDMPADLSLIGGWGNACRCIAGWDDLFADLLLIGATRSQMFRLFQDCAADMFADWGNMFADCCDTFADWGDAFAGWGRTFAD